MLHIVSGGRAEQPTIPRRGGWRRVRMQAPPGAGTACVGGRHYTPHDGVIVVRACDVDAPRPHGYVPITTATEPAGRCGWRARAARWLLRKLYASAQRGGARDGRH